MSFLSTYRNRLINLSSSNRALCLLRALQGQDLDLSSLNFTLHNNSFEYIRALIAGKKQVPLLTVLDARDAAANKISAQLRRIQRRDKALQEESGSQDLFVGWPFVEGLFIDGTPVRCPLLLFPVALIEEGNQWKLALRDDEPWVFNKTFQLAFAHYNNIPLASLPEPDPEDFSNDPTLFRTQLFEFLRDNNYTLNFNRELFEDKLNAFQSTTKSDFVIEQKEGQLKLQPQAVLGIFPYAGSWLVNDYDHIEEFGDGWLFGTSETLAPALRIDSLAPIKEEQIFCPLPLDGAQEEALRMVRGGNSMVVQGPPGTGKSQLIVNLIADYASRGKKVLVVSQKRAALEVVQQRLKQCGLENFNALIHDLRAERSMLYQQIATQIENTEEYQRQNNQLDTVYLEREYIAACRTIDQSLEKLEEFKSALYDTKRFGISAKELYLNTPSERPAIDLSAVAGDFDKTTAENFSRKLSLLLPRVQKNLHTDYPFAERRSFAGFGAKEQREMEGALDSVYVLQQQYKHLKSTQPEISFQHVKAWQGRREEIKGVLANVEPGENQSRYATICTEDSWEKIKRCLSYKTADPFFFLKHIEELRILFHQKIKVIQEDEIAILEKQIPIAKKIRASFLAKLRWSFQAPKEIKDILKRLSIKPEELSVLEKLVEYWKRKISVIQKLGTHKWILPLSAYSTSEEFDRWDLENFQLLNTKGVLEAISMRWAHLNWKKMSSSDITSAIKPVDVFLDTLRASRITLNPFVQESQLEHWVSSEVSIDTIRQTLRYDFAVLCETDAMMDELRIPERTVLKQMAQQSPLVASDFTPALQHSWIEALERQHPCLQQTSTGTLDFLESELQHALDKKQELSLKIISLRLREYTYRYAEYNRLQNRTTYRELFHQTTKKKKIWPVRKLVQEFHEELFRLIPCWMASPETVSALFPPEQYFDLVIFDEASQCYAEKGVPAMMRGKQCVIAGDSKQLRPGDLYRVRWEEESEESLEEEAESLLELAAQKLPQVMLRYHYRSSRNELIDFSNQHFYQNKLQLLPDANQKESQAVFYHRVNGVWAGQQNRAEAGKVLSLLKTLLDEGNESIGIVTFNFLQAELIQELLEEKVREEHWNIPAEVFVKNLENVQGDERDVIIFSTAYAPDEKGRMQLRFGSLNQEDGANRLNVAVTRARNEIHLVCSLQPSELDASNSLHEGPKKLQAYLQYAWDVSQGKKLVAPADKRTSPDWYLSTKLCTGQWKLSSMPLADLEFGNVLLITDDDQLYGRTCKETFGLIPRAILKKGWEYQRKYSRNWFVR